MVSMSRARALPGVREVAEAYLCAVDAEAPGLVTGLYLLGSVALGDYRPGQSDIDFLALTARRPGATDAAALRRAHARIGRRYPRPFFDGCYVLPGDLPRDPGLVRGALDAHEGRVALATAGLDPIAWHTLARHGAALRGPAPATLRIRDDPATLARWTRGNLDVYWRPWLARAARWPSPLALAGLGTWAPAWGVLGATRLHYTLATGLVTSKTGAGRYALATFPERWHRIVRECLRIRRGDRAPSLYPHPVARRREALDYLAMAIDAAARLG
jgi:hypothetical protein